VIKEAPLQSSSAHEPPSCLQALQVVAALGTISLRDLASLTTACQTGIADALDNQLLMHDGSQLRVRDASLADRALQYLTQQEKIALHLDLAASQLPPDVRARQLDLATPEGPDEYLALQMDDAAAIAEKKGDYRAALDLWTRAARRSQAGPNHQFQRQMRMAERAYENGDFRRAVRALLELDFSELNATQSGVAVDLLYTADYISAGTEAARERIENMERSLPAECPANIVLQVHIAGLVENSQERLDRLEALLPSLASERTPSRLRFNALGHIALSKVNVGLGLDPATVAELRTLESLSGVQPVALEDSTDALEAFLAYQVGDVSTSRRLLPTLLAKAEVQSQPAQEDAFLVHSAHVDIIQGRFRTASERLARRENLAMRPKGSPIVVRAEGLLALELGEMNQLEEIIAQPHASGTEAIGRLTRDGLRGLAQARQEDHKGAIRSLRDCIDASFRLGIKEPGRRMWVDVELARSYVRTGRLEKADEIATFLEELDVTGPLSPARMQAQRIRSLIALSRGEHSQAVEAAKLSLNLADGVDWLPERARLLVDVLNIAAKSALSPCPSFDWALRTSKDTVRLLEDGAAKRSLERTIRQNDFGDLRKLTGAELRVAEVVARGLSNKAASAELFLSPRTVESHLESIYRKLELKSRSQLVALIRGNATDD